MNYLNNLKQYALEKYEEIKDGLTIAAVVLVLTFIGVMANLALTVMGGK